ncbi:MAG: peptidase, partial [Mucilaginibacter sp.]|nr:peptidase [Mucilaginibacter sp.]
MKYFERKWIKLALILLMGAMQQELYAQEDVPEAKKLAIADKKYSREVSIIGNKEVIKKAFQTIVDLQPQTLQDHILLTQIPAPPYKEMVRATKYAELMKAAGADSVWIDNVGNLIAKLKGRVGKRTVVLEGHMDTVFPEGT